MSGVTYVVVDDRSAARTVPAGDRAEDAAGVAQAFRARVGGREIRWDAAPDDAGGSTGADGSRTRGTRTAALRLVTQVGRAFEHAHPGVRPILAHGRHLVVDGSVDLGSTDHWRVMPLPDGIAIAEPSTAAPARLDDAARALADAVDAEAFRADVAWLSGFPTRHSLSSGFAQALDGAQARLDALGYTTRREPVTVGTGACENLVADRTGDGGDGLVVVTAHLDSINQAGGPTAQAPGADDNGSGSAGLLELARVLATRAWRHDLRLVLFGGEEEGLFGSTQHVAALPRTDRTRIRAVLNMDMIGTRNTGAATVLLEGAELSSSQIADLASAAAAVTGLAVETSLSPFASDHVPFINRRIPAVLTIEGGDSANSHIHSAADVAAHVDPAFAREILRMNVVALAGWLVPAVPTDDVPTDPVADDATDVC
ncbi:M28 family metallopeptidase [Cellulomonas sp. URHB0016]